MFLGRASAGGSYLGGGRGVRARGKYRRGAGPVPRCCLLQPGQAVQNVGDARLFPLALMGEVNAERGAQNVAHPDVVPGRNVIAHRFLPRDVRRAPALLLGPEKLDLLLRRWPPAFAEVESHEGLGPDLEAVAR